MNQPAKQASKASLPRSQQTQIDELRREFAAALKTSLLPRAEDLIESVAAEARAAAVVDLLTVEFGFLIQDGQEIDIDAYRRRFPKYRAAVDEAFRLASETPDSAAETSGPETGGERHASPSVFLPPTLATPRLESTDNDAVTDEPIPSKIGRYEIRDVLGEGGFGRVYRAFDTHLQRLVALKVPGEKLLASGISIDVLLAEAQFAAALSHPGLVPVYDVQVTDDRPYIVQKLIDGTDLHTWRRTTQPTQREMIACLIEVTEAVGYAHQQRCIHRDLKPRNILLDREGRAYVADFGLAVNEHIQRQRAGEVSGTPAYMAPEQIRGETHRLDGRSDLWSLGVILYEMLVGSRPFSAPTHAELYDLIATNDPRPPRQLCPDVPAELERICLKCMEKRRTDRYASAADLLEDLYAWMERRKQTKQRTVAPEAAVALPPARVIPKGLRAFDRHDANFFLELLPGPRDRDGLPESVRFWKTKIEESDPEQTFPVGLLYGPSGCGKSSLVKAALVPHLDSRLRSVYIEATYNETEIRLTRVLRKEVSQLPATENLLQLMRAAREHCEKSKQKLLIIIDQFEQWLHSHQGNERLSLIHALRQCDGQFLQCVVIVRDDFWMPVTEFFAELEIDLIQGQNTSSVSLFGLKHAKQVLVAFGEAYGTLDSDSRTTEQEEFLQQAVSELAQGDKIVCVRLAIFAEMFKEKPWTLDSLRKVGGTRGVGVVFLEETFVTHANPKHRLHGVAARAVLASLLPEAGGHIKGGMKSYAELQESSGYQTRPQDFAALIQILDNELRLITPTNPDGANRSIEDSDSNAAPRTANEHYYQLTHDYLVPSLQEWLTSQQQGTRRGRAELTLSERGALWRAKPENRHLPSLWEWCSIYALTDRKKWTESQRSMMSRARRVILIRTLAVSALVVALMAGLFRMNQNAASRRNDAEASMLVDGLVRADTSQVDDIIMSLGRYHEWAHDDLLEAFNNPPRDLPNAKLHAALALLPHDAPKGNATDDPNIGEEYRDIIDALSDSLLTVSPEQFRHVRQLLENHKSKLIDSYWKIVKNTTTESTDRRFQAACALASFDSTNEYWKNRQFTTSIVAHLVQVSPSAFTSWRDALAPVKSVLVGPLGEVFRADSSGESVRSLATDSLAKYLKDDPAVLTNLVLEADAVAYRRLLPVLARHQQVAVRLLNDALDQTLDPDWEQHPQEAAWAVVTPKTKAIIESADGTIHEHFAVCQTLPWADFEQTARDLHAAGYRPTRVRPYGSEQRLVAAIWHRDGGRFKLDAAVELSLLPDPASSAHKDGLLPVDLAINQGTQQADTGSSSPDSPEKREPKYVILWGPSEGGGENEERRLVANLDARQWQEHHKSSSAAGFATQITTTLGTTPSGELRFGGIWSNRGAPSEQRQVSPQDLRIHDQTLRDVDSVGEQYSLLGQADIRFESKIVTADSPAEMIERISELGKMSFRPVAIDMGNSETHSQRPTIIFHRPFVSAKAKDQLASRQATAAVTLLRLGAPERVWSLLQNRPDPRLRTFLIGRMANFETQAEPILRQLAKTTDISERRALIIVAGEFANSDRLTSAEKEALVAELTDTYTDDKDAGIHGATEWTLRQLNAREVIETVREAYALGKAVGDRQWYLTQKTRQTMVILDANDPFLMGSPLTELERYQGPTGQRERRHLRRIGRKYAIAAHEVTVEQFQQFRPDHSFNRANSRESDAPANHISWYHAAAYCNWLSEQEGLAEEEWCYDPQQRFGEGMTIRADYLERTGYRLPTEAEWEYACRAGTSTARYFGESDILLDQYAWYSEVSQDKWMLPVGSLKPNSWGLFDMLGNSYEWCNGRQVGYPNDRALVEDVVDTESLSNGNVRVLRGGSFFNNAHNIRSANRSTTRPDLLDNGNGFRPARTLAPEDGQGCWRDEQVWELAIPSSENSATLPAPSFGPGNRLARPNRPTFMAAGWFTFRKR